MKIDSRDYRTTGGGVQLKDWSTTIEDICSSEKHYKQLLEKHVEALSDLQRIHYASNHYALSDMHERKFWKEYMRAYEECLTETSTEIAPWYVVPADDKDNARLIVSQIVLDALGDMKMSYPEVTAERHQELKAIRKMLEP